MNPYKRLRSGRIQLLFVLALACGCGDSLVDSGTASVSKQADQKPRNQQQSKQVVSQGPQKAATVKGNEKVEKAPAVDKKAPAESKTGSKSPLDAQKSVGKSATRSPEKTAPGKTSPGKTSPGKTAPGKQLTGTQASDGDQAGPAGTGPAKNGSAIENQVSGDVDPVQDPGEIVGDRNEPEEEPFPALPPVSDELTMLHKEQRVWLDFTNKEKKAIVLDGEICFRRGALELLVTQEGGKEHESVIKVKAAPSTIHTALLLIGGNPGSPVRFHPEYQSATGSIVDIEVQYNDPDGKLHTMRAQEFARKIGGGEVLNHDWVFGGSGMRKDPATDRLVYIADLESDFICVSNFPTATLDLTIQSPKDNANLVYEAFTENIPPKGSPVRLRLTVRPEPKQAQDAAFPGPLLPDDMKEDKADANSGGADSGDAKADGAKSDAKSGDANSGDAAKQ